MRTSRTSVLRAISTWPFVSITATVLVAVLPPPSPAGALEWDDPAHYSLTPTVVASSAFSHHGRYIAVATQAALQPYDTNDLTDVYVISRDPETGALQPDRVSQPVVPELFGEQPNGASTSPSISADGRYVAFVSSASNLVEGDTNGVADAFLVDRATRSLRRVSLTPGGDELQHATLDAFVSGNGQYLIIRTAAPLVSEDTNTSPDTYRIDLSTGAAVPVSLTSSGDLAPTLTHHRMTDSWGSGMDKAAYREAQRAAVKAGGAEVWRVFEIEVASIRTKFGAKYDEAIEQAREQLQNFFKRGCFPPSAPDG